MDINNLMKQAQQMQEKMAKMQEQAAATEVTLMSLLWQADEDAKRDERAELVFWPTDDEMQST